MAVYRVPFNVTFSGAGGPGANVWHVRTLSDFSPVNTDLQGLVNNIRTFYTSCASLYPNTATITLGTVTEVGTSNESVPSFTAVVGTGGTGLAPQALALVVTWRTSVAARRGRGRTFLGPLASGAMQTDGTVADALLGTARTAATALVTASTASGNGAISVYGLQNQATGDNPDYASLPHVARDITGSQIRDLFGVLRSRRD